MTINKLTENNDAKMERVCIIQNASSRAFQIRAATTKEELRELEDKMSSKNPDIIAVWATDNAIAVQERARQVLLEFRAEQDEYKIEYQMIKNVLSIIIKEVAEE
jgi:hypothetical protein